MRFLLPALMLLFAMPALAQCKDDMINCRGECGKFIDLNGDGFCDDSIIDSSLLPKPPALLVELPVADTEPKTRIIAPVKINEPKRVKEVKSAETAFHFAEKKEIKDTPVQVAVKNPGVIFQSPPKQRPTANKKQPYHFLSVIIPLVIIYLSLQWMVYRKKLSKAQVLKFWNILLLLTFVVTAVLGLLITAKIIYKLHLPETKAIYLLHVDFGVAMAVITLFHLSRHWKYYTKLIK